MKKPAAIRRWCLILRAGRPATGSPSAGSIVRPQAAGVSVQFVHRLLIVLALWPTAGFAAGAIRLPGEDCPGYYTGRIEPDLEVRLFLSRDGNRLIGSSRYVYDELRVEGSIDPATGAFTLTEFLPSREGGEQSGGRFKGRLAAGGALQGVWENRSGRITRPFRLNEGGRIETGGNPSFPLHLEVAEGGLGNYRGWLLWGSEAFDLGEACIHQWGSAMSAPDFENLQIEVLPGQPELVHTAVGMTTAVREEVWLHKLFGPGSMHPLMQIEGGRRRFDGGLAATTIEFAYRGREILVRRLDEETGGVEPSSRSPFGRLAPACAEAAREQIFRFELDLLDDSLVLVPQPDPEEFGERVVEARTFSPLCEEDPAPEDDLGPAAVIRTEAGLLAMQVGPDPASGGFEAVCWLAGQSRAAPPGFAVPPPGAVRPGLTAAVPLTVRWPAAGGARAVAVFLDPGEAGSEPGNADLVAFYDRTSGTCYHRLLKEAGEWGSPMDELVFRRRFGGAN